MGVVCEAHDGWKLTIKLKIEQSKPEIITDNTQVIWSLFPLWHETYVDNGESSGKWRVAASGAERGSSEKCICALTEPKGVTWPLGPGPLCGITSNSGLLAFVRGIHQWPVNSWCFHSNWVAQLSMNVVAICLWRSIERSHPLAIHITGVPF